MSRKLQVIEVLDWYDGIVVGLVRCSWRSGVFLASLLTWSPEGRTRRLALVPLTDQQLAIARHNQTDWQAHKGALRAIVDAYKGDVSLVSLVEASDEVVEEESTAIERISPLLLGTIEEAIENEAHNRL